MCVSDMCCDKFCNTGGSCAGGCGHFSCKWYGKIYKITGPNGKAYIGYTTQIMHRRFAAHRRGAGTGCRALSNAIRKYGKAAFSAEVLLWDVPKEQLGEREREMIAIHNTLAPNGYNITPGGEVSPMTNSVVRARQKAICSQPTIKKRRCDAQRATVEQQSQTRKTLWKNDEFRLMMLQARINSKAVEKKRITQMHRRRERMQSMHPDEAAFVEWDAHKRALDKCRRVGRGFDAVCEAYGVGEPCIDPEVKKNGARMHKERLKAKRTAQASE